MLGFIGIDVSFTFGYGYLRPTAAVSHLFESSGPQVAQFSTRCGPSGQVIMGKDKKQKLNGMGSKCLLGGDD